MEIRNISKEYPAFGKIVENIISLNPFQKITLTNYFSTQGIEFWRVIQELEPLFERLINNEQDEFVKLAKGYNRVCYDMIQEQKEFEGKHKYSESRFKDVNNKIYQNPDIMNYYINGLIISQLLWPNHFKMYNFFRQNCLPRLKEGWKILEIGIGHGLFLSTALKHTKNVTGLGIDISSTSLEASSRTLKAMDIPEEKYQLLLLNINDAQTLKGKYNFIIAGELLEHLEEPLAMLKDARRVANTDNMVFFTTCVNCPAIDHIYLFHSIEEIRDLAKEAGLRITDDLALPYGNVTIKEALLKKTCINYCAYGIFENIKNENG